MTDYESKLDSLPYRVDLGGIVYNLRSNTRVLAGDYSANDFYNTFQKYDKPKTEYLLRKYMFQDVKPKEDLVFDNDDDKKDLIQILEKRVDQIEQSMESSNTNYNQSILINRKMGRSAQNILEIINKLKNTKIAKKSIDDEFIRKTIGKLDQDCIYELILEISWMLLNFNTVSTENKDVIDSWMELVKSLPHLKLEHMVKMLGQDPETSEEPFESKESFEPGKDSMEKLIKTLLNILEIKRFLTPTKTSGGARARSRSRSRSRSKSKKTKIKFDKKMSNAMIPLFDYFKDLYDPIFSFIDECALSYKINPQLVSELVDILHVCNNIHTPGIYHIKNVSNVLPFIKHIINNTKSHMISDDTFIDKISQLPKVRLTTFLKESTLNINRHIQLFSVDDNLTIHPESRLNNRIKKFFNKKDLYITCTEPTDLTIPASIPMKLHEIDFNTIDVTNDIEIYSLKPFHSDSSDSYDLDHYVSLNKNLNDSEIALSIFILFKELIYK